MRDDHRWVEGWDPKGKDLIWGCLSCHKEIRVVGGMTRARKEWAEEAREFDAYLAEQEQAKKGEP